VLALRGDGTVWAWGDNSYWQLGDTLEQQRQNAARVAGLSGVRVVSAGDQFSLAALGDGTVRGWGNDSEGELGTVVATACPHVLNPSACTATPVQLPDLTAVTGLAADSMHALALGTVPLPPRPTPTPTATPIATPTPGPATDAWQALPGLGISVPASSLVWDGTEMIAWGGLLSAGNPGSGARFNPSTLQWSPVAQFGAPQDRYGNTAVWTGSEVIIWGGETYVPGSGYIRLNDGRRYDPTPTPGSRFPPLVRRHLGVITRPSGRGAT
jgi:hypothetical protein